MDLIFELRFPVALCIAALLLGSGAPHRVQAQAWNPAQSGTVEVETGATAATGESAPFWLHTNTWGLVDPASSAGWVRARVSNEMEPGGRWGVAYGAEAIGRASAAETVYLSELYAEGRYGFLRLRVGRKQEVIGSPAGPLTTGSIGRSSNATPIPKIVVATDGYTAVPFTSRWLEFRGRYAHGWLPDDRVTEGAYLHQKTLYLRAGTPSPVQVQAGLIHNAMWGGTSPRFGRLPASFNDYMRTVVALNGSEDAPPGEEAYIQGNHLGAIDIGLSAQVGPFGIDAYRQFIYEDRDNLKLKSPQDGLFGVVLTDNRSGRWIDRLVYEHLYTKWQNGPVAPGGTERGGAGGQDNYYNHYIYKSGWTLYGRTAGSSLLSPRPDGAGIANNRVVGHHLGVAGHAGSVAYRVLATYSRNYGTYRDEDIAQDAGRDYRFNPPLEQTSFLIGARLPWPTDERFEVQAALAWDVGELYEDGVGARVGLTYHPFRDATE